MDQHELTKKNNKLMIEMDRKREGTRTKYIKGPERFAIARSKAKALKKRAHKEPRISNRVEMMRDSAQGMDKKFK